MFIEPTLRWAAIKPNAEPKESPSVGHKPKRESANFVRNVLGNISYKKERYDKIFIQFM